MAGNGFTDEGVRIQPVATYNPETGEYVAGGGGGGSGDASASNQVTGNTRLGDVTETAPASDTASSGLNGRLQRIAQRLTSFMALFPASLGSKAASASLAVTDSTEDIARMGIVTETAPASDTASSGVNGRLQRIAQRITSLITALTDGTARAVLNAGSAIIGKVGIDQTTPGTTNGVVIKDSAGNAIDQSATVNVAQDVNAMKNGATTLTPKYAKIAASTSGNNTLVAAVTGKKIRVLAYNFMGAGAVNAKFQDGAGGTDLTGLKYIAAAGGGICAPFNPVGWFETTAATLLNLNLSGAVAVGGEFTYVEV